MAMTGDQLLFIAMLYFFAGAMIGAVLWLGLKLSGWRFF